MSSPSEKEHAMRYYTKCGMEFNKSTKADTTGYHLYEENGQIQDPKCAICPFAIDVKDGWGDNTTHKRFECRAGSLPPNCENTYSGKAEDKATLRINSLDHEFCESIIAFAQAHPELGAQYTQDEADCRRSISITCSANKKGMAAKQELIDCFFTFAGFDVDDESDEDLESETDIVLECEDSKRKSQCPFIGSIGEMEIKCGFNAQYLNNYKFDNTNDCRDKADLQCFNNFNLCETYKKNYQAFHNEFMQSTCGYCCHNSGCTGLREDQDSSMLCYCTLNQHSINRRNPACANFNRHVDLDETIPKLKAWETKENSKASVGKANDITSIPVLSDAPEALTTRSAFDYALVDQDTAEFLQAKSMKIFEIKMRSDILIGKEFLEAHSRLANNKNGTFEKWVASLGISHKTARNYINRYEYVLKNFHDITDAESIQPSLLLEISKPSAPKELQEAVMAGDITTHKEYKKLLEDLEHTKLQLGGAKLEIKASEESVTNIKKQLIEQKLNSPDPEDMDVLKDELRLAQAKAKFQKQTNIDLCDEIEKLKAQLAEKPIEATAVEVKEVVHEALSTSWCDNIETMIAQLAKLTDEELYLIIQTAGRENYAVMKDSLRINASRASKVLDKLETAIFRVPAGWADFVLWLENGENHMKELMEEFN